MDALDLMMEEHQNIKRGLALIRIMCISLFSTKALNLEDYYSLIEFVRNYADKHHHEKEENILFKKMEEEMGESAKGPLTGMYIEHDLGRIFISNLEQALKKAEKGDREAPVDIIANAIAYVDLLGRHIAREDEVIYQFARRSLSKESLILLTQESEIVESQGKEKGIQEKYLQMLNSLERKYWQS